MTRCTACGADNKAVAKFCRQCGASLAVAAVPAAGEDEHTVMMPPPPPPGAARVKPEAPAATAGADMTPVFPPDATRRVSSAETMIPPPPAPRSQPAYAAPRGAAATPPAKRNQMPLLIGLGVVALAVLGAGGYYAWTLTRPAGQEAASPPAVAQAPAAAAPAAPPPPIAAEPVRSSPPETAPTAAPEPTVVPAATDIATPAAAPPPKPETTPEAPAVPKSGAAAKPGEGAKGTPARPEKAKRKSLAETKSQAPPPPAATEPAAAPQPQAAPAPQPDPQTARFARMQDEMRACGTFNVFCQERVRWKYCSGYWGKVPQCPGGSRPGEGD